MTIADILKEQDEYKTHSHEIILWPQKWLMAKDNYIWKLARLSVSDRDGIPAESGIYSLLVQPGISGHPACSYLMYIGQSNNLNRRFNEYLNEKNREKGRPKIVRLLNKYPDNLWFCYTLISLFTLDDVEQTLINAYMPPANDQFFGEIIRVVGAFR